MRIKVAISLTLLALAAGACNYQSQGRPALETTPNDITTEARTFIDLLAKSDFDAAVQKFDGEMKEGLPAAKLRETWQAVQAQFGAFNRQVSIRKGKAQGYDVVFVKCDFEKGPLGIRLTFNSQKEIAGMFFDPAE